jgi:hypothetical protein
MIRVTCLRCGRPLYEYESASLEGGEIFGLCVQCDPNEAAPSSGLAVAPVEPRAASQSPAGENRDSLDERGTWPSVRPRHGLILALVVLAAVAGPVLVAVLYWMRGRLPW